MVSECPVCQQYINPLRFLLRLSSWRCTACGSLLLMDRKRRWLAVIPFAVVVLSISIFLTRSGWSDYTPILVGLILWLPCYLIFDRAVVLEEHGFRCKRCGYDLRGQQAPLCPECGRPFDAEDLDQMRMTDPNAVVRQRGRRSAYWWVIAVILIIVLLASLALGIWQYLRM